MPTLDITIYPSGGATASGDPIYTLGVKELTSGELLASGSAITDVTKVFKLTAPPIGFAPHRLTYSNGKISAVFNPDPGSTIRSAMVLTLDFALDKVYLDTSIPIDIYVNGEAVDGILRGVFVNGDLVSDDDVILVNATFFVNGHPTDDKEHPAVYLNGTLVSTDLVILVNADFFVNMHPTDDEYKPLGYVNGVLASDDLIVLVNATFFVNGHPTDDGLVPTISTNGSLSSNDLTILVNGS